MTFKFSLFLLPVSWTGHSHWGRQKIYIAGGRWTRTLGQSLTQSQRSGHSGLTVKMIPEYTHTSSDCRGAPAHSIGACICISPAFFILTVKSYNNESFFFFGLISFQYRITLGFTYPHLSGNMSSSRQWTIHPPDLLKFH